MQPLPRKRILLACFLIILLLSACAQSPSRRALSTSIPIPTARITPTRLATSTPTIASSQTLTPEVSPVITPSPTPLSSPTTSPTLNLSIRFAVIGDYGGNGVPEADVASLVKSWRPDFVITTGDNNYPNGSDKTIDLAVGKYFSNFIFPYLGKGGPGADQNRFFPTLGNHDWNTAKGRPYFDYFTLPGNERYYDFTWGPVHFFALDSDSREPDGVSASSKQALWLKNRLAASTERWKIVYMHHPPYSSGRHGSVDWMRWPFQEWGASAVLAGHDHTYERIVRDGFPYFVNGLGGGSRYSFAETVQGSQVRYNKDYGAMLVTADETQIIFQFFSRSGEVIDTYYSG